MIRAFGDTWPHLAERVWIDESAQVIGSVALGEDASVWPLASIRGDVNHVHVGARTNIQDNCVLHVTHDGPYTPGGAALTVGNDVTVGHGVILHACTIGHRCLIGMGAIVMDKVVIDDEVLLAAGSIVPSGKRLNGGWLYRGSPAQPVRELTADERAHLSYSAQHYVRLKDRYLASDSASSAELRGG